MDDDVHPGEHIAREYHERSKQAGALLNKRREQLGQAKEAGLERVLKIYEQNADVDNATLEDIEPEHFIDKGFSKHFAKGAADYVAQQAAEELGVDTDPESLESHQLIQTYTGATRQAFEQQVKSYLAQLGGLEDLTTSGLSQHMQENLQGYSEIEQKVKQYAVGHIDEDDKQDLVEYAGIDDVLRAEYTPAGLVAEFGKQTYQGKEVPPEAVAQQVGGQAPQALQNKGFDMLQDATDGHRDTANGLYDLPDHRMN